MLAQQISKVMPWLVGVSLLSAIGGVVLAQTYPDQACFWAYAGQPTRQPPCIDFGSCRWGPEIKGVCYVGRRDPQPILSGDRFQEVMYRYCSSFPDTKCEIKPPIPCLTYRAYIDAQCEWHPPGCFGTIDVPGCETHLGGN